tara:strand:- start:1091 stop:1753 length:663 start_codon:yes stop_codon:yes gene_type:complete
MESILFKLQKTIKVKFKNIELLKKAITHKSFDSINNYEKLEFLGDRLLGLIISKKLLSMYPEVKEGLLDKKLASLVNKEKCYEVGKKLKLDKFVLVGNNKKGSKVEIKIISDSIESLIGAIYYEKGFDFVEKFVLNLWKDLLESSKITLIDAKTKLQEYSLKKFKILPMYKLINTSGPKHNPIFKIAVRLKNSEFVDGTGKSKKIAEQDAANRYIKKFNL